MHDSVYDIACGDRRRISLLRSALTQLADGPNEPLREMATGVLRGEIDLRAAANFEFYGSEIDQATDRFRSYYDKLSAAERRELTEKGREYVDSLGPPE